MLSIYIVEDNPAFSETLEKIVHFAYPGAEIKKFYDGASLLSEIESFSPDLIFMDINLPDVDGLTLTRKIRKKSKKVKIIVMTMYDDPEYAAAAIESGADGFIAKDMISIEEILKFD